MINYLVSFLNWLNFHYVLPDQERFFSLRGAKISNFELLVFKKNIFNFKISMCYAFVMHELNTLTYVFHNAQDHMLRYLFLTVLNHIDKSETSFAKFTQNQHFECLNTRIDVILLIDLWIDILNDVGMFLTLWIINAEFSPDLDFFLGPE